MSISIPQAFTSITDTWAPHLVATVNDHHVKIVKIDGSFVFHSHPDTDELFYVLSGSMKMRFEDGRPDVVMPEGDMYVVPRGVRHCPVAENARVMIVEKVGTVNTGDAPVSERTKAVNTRLQDN